MNTLELIFLLAHLISTDQFLDQHTLQFPMTIFVKVFLGLSKTGIHHCLFSLRKCSLAWQRLPYYLRVQKTCYHWFMKFNENLLTRIVWRLRTNFFKCRSGSIQQIPIKFLPCKATILEALGYKLNSPYKNKFSPSCNEGFFIYQSWQEIED